MLDRKEAFVLLGVAVSLGMAVYALFTPGLFIPI